MRTLTLITLISLIGCSKQTECDPYEPIGCMCNNGNIYAPKIQADHTTACIDSCADKGGMNKLFCR